MKPTQERKITEVIDQVVAKLPDSEVDVRLYLVQLRQSCIYTAPELMGDRWGQFSLILEDNLPDPATGPEWTREIVEIMGGEA